jgi:neurofibromin 1
MFTNLYALKSVADIPQTSALRPRDSYPTEQHTLLKPLDVSTSGDIIYSILVFLDASPLTIFLGAPDNGPEWTIFFEDIFTSFAAFLVLDDDRIRYMTNTVTRRIMTSGSVMLWHKSKSLGSRTFKYNFWKST